MKEILTKELYEADETSAQEVFLDLEKVGRSKVCIIAKASVATDFIVQASADNIHWYDVETFSAVTSAYKVYDWATRYVKLKSAAAGVAGDTVDLILSALEA